MRAAARTEQGNICGIWSHKPCRAVQEAGVQRLRALPAALASFMGVSK